MTDAQDFQRAYKAHMAYADNKPEWMQMACEACNAWGNGDGTLQVCIAQKLEEAYAMGRAKTPPVYTPPHASKSVNGVMRRSRTPSPLVEDVHDDIPPPPRTIIRRSK